MVNVVRIIGKILYNVSAYQNKMNIVIHEERVGCTYRI